MAEEVTPSPSKVGAGRKFWLGIVYVGVLVAVLVFMVERLGDKFDAVMFAAWLTAFTVAYVTYVMGNAAVAGAVAKITNTVTSMSTSTEKTETKKDGA